MSGNINSVSAALELTSEPAAIADMGRIVYMNPAARALTGRGEAGFPAEELLPSHVINCQAQMFVTGGMIAGQSCAIRADYADGLRVYFFDPDEGISAQGLFSALTVLREELLNLKLAADRVVSMAEVSGDPKFDQYKAVLYHSYYRLKRLVQNISVIDGLVNGGLPFSPAAADLGTLCGDVVSAVSTFAGSTGVSVQFESRGAVMVNADSELFELMLLNLITNSLAHTPKGGTVRVGVAEFPGGVIVSVDDTGSGIEPETMKSIFSRYRETLNLADMSEGAGLGLAIARGIAEKHGGALIIESRRGSGASVRVSMSKETMPTVRFRSAEAEYSPKGMELLLTQLSTWLDPAAYGREYDE